METTYSDGYSSTVLSGGQQTTNNIRENPVKSDEQLINHLSQIAPITTVKNITNHEYLNGSADTSSLLISEDTKDKRMLALDQDGPIMNGTIKQDDEQQEFLKNELPVFEGQHMRGMSHGDHF